MSIPYCSSKLNQDVCSLGQFEHQDFEMNKADEVDPTRCKTNGELSYRDRTELEQRARTYPSLFLPFRLSSTTTNVGSGFKLLHA